MAKIGDKFVIEIDDISKSRHFNEVESLLTKFATENLKRETRKRTNLVQ